MAISETAQKNHDELFPNHKSTLALTDPELIEVFDNFAFDEVLSYGNLDTKTRLMVILASLIAQQTLSEYKAMLSGALNVGVTSIGVTPTFSAPLSMALYSLNVCWAISDAKITISLVFVSRFPYESTSSKAKLSNTSISSGSVSVSVDL